jgi:hypothetical protein
MILTEFGCGYFRTTQKSHSFNYLGKREGVAALGKSRDMIISLGLRFVNGIPCIGESAPNRRYYDPGVHTSPLAT